MLSPADRIIEATIPYTLRLQKNDREKVIAAALEFIIQEYQYNPYWLKDCDEGEYNVIDVREIKNLIQELKETVTLEEHLEVNSQK